MVVHQGLAYIPTATGGGGGAGSSWVGAVITVGLLISPVALPHLSHRLKTLMVCMYASPSLLKKKILCHLCVPGFVKPPLMDFRKKILTDLCHFWNRELSFRNFFHFCRILKFFSTICLSLLEFANFFLISHFFFFFFFFFFFYFFFSGFFCLQASGFK